jgi:2-keto-4-pentenoate hydratase/2-oxohepta-3-ene-1,7-dioic acid hydratase in catechol pathway
MRWARIASKNGPTFAIVEEDRVHPVGGTPFGAWERLAGPPLQLAETKLLVPLVPNNFYACGLNYSAHVAAMAVKLGRDQNLPSRAEVGLRARSGLIATGETILIPPDATEQIHYEGELVVVIGRQAKNIPQAEALSCVLGYTIGNDVTDRGWQKADRILWRSKNADTFSPIGPWIETDVDLDSLTTRILVNGKLEHAFATNAMLFGVAEFIATISRYSTLQPGDMIWMGTDGESTNLRDGDIVEVEIDQIGRLSNPIRKPAEVPAQPLPA